jgi:hypothetical protein
MAERGTGDNVYFDGSDNFVVFEVGKRGSGKSYGMGSLLESFATSETSAIGAHKERRAVLLLDPLDIHWTALLPLSADGPESLKKQHEILRKWGDLSVEPINVRVFVPAGYGWDVDRPEFREYQVPVRSLTAGDWALLIKADLVTDTRGRLIDEAYRKVTELGWGGRDGVPRHEPIAEYGISDLIDCIDNDPEVSAFYATETCRSVVQPLRALARMPLFASREGTQMTELAQLGVLSILCLARLPEDLRTVVTTVLVRKLRADRMYASQIRRRLALAPDDEATRQRLSDELSRHVPRTILAIDEAQVLMPARSSSTARQALDSYVLEGRNYGLSLWLATQRPKGAISDAAASQIDTFIVHRLSVADDISAVCGLLQNAQPDRIRLHNRDINLAELVRSLDVGQAIFSSANSTGARFVVANVRPRMVAHGGEAF